MKKSVAKLFALVLAVLMIVTVAACKTAPTATNTTAATVTTAAPADAATTAPPAAATGVKKVGVSMPTKSLQRWNQDGSYMEQMFKDAGYQVDLQYGGENEVPVQINQIENMIAGGCDVLVIAAIDGESLTEVLADAKAKNIPVIAYDRLIMGTDAVTYYATFDNWKVGTFQGDYVKKALNLDSAAGPFNIEFFTGDPGDNNINFFFGGAMEVLQPYLDNGKLVCPSGQTEKLTVATEGWKTENAQSRMENIISSQNYGPTKTALDAVMCSNDSTAQGVTNALANAGYTAANFPVVTGQDCDIVSCKNMIAGTQAMSVFKDTRTLAAQVVKMVTQYLNGQTVEVNDTKTYDNGTGVIPSFLCEPLSYTVSDLQKLVDSGYYTADEIGLTAGAGAPAAPAGGGKVGVSMPTKSLQRWNQDGSNMKQMFEDAGYQVDLQYGGENEVPVQINQIENMIAGGCTVLVIAAIDGESLTEVLADAKAKNIPVIAYDRLIMGTDAVSYYATFDNWKVGTFQGEYIKNTLNLDGAAGPFNIEFFTGDPGDNNINFFFGGAMEVLQPYLDSGKLVCPSGQTDKLTVATEGWKTENAQSRMENIISSQNYGPTKTALDAVMCSNDSTAQGVTNALANAGYTAANFPVITGQDCDIVSCKNMIAGTQAMSVFKDTRTLAAQVVKMVTQYLNGQAVDVNDTATYNNGTGVIPSFLCEPLSYTAGDIPKLIESGYYTEDELR